MIRVWHGRTWEDIPAHDLASVLLSPEVFASYSGPDIGLAATEVQDENLSQSKSPSNGCPTKSVAGARTWRQKSRKAYGITMSLYDQHPVNKKMSGDPIADAFAICARKNNAILIVADGVNWGEKSRLAARAAVYGSMAYLNRKLFGEIRQLNNTQDAIRLIRESFNEAHSHIMKKRGGLTTLCVALVLPLQDSDQSAVCCVNVGDSFAFVFSKRWGLREITVGSHDIQTERDIRDAGGALGPVNGSDPELHNLTCSVTFVDPGDVVMLTSDGISDNFDPVVTKIAIASLKGRCANTTKTIDAICDNGTLGKPLMLPHERHQYSIKEMERMIHEFELFTEIPCSAQEICGCIVQHVLALTDPKRQILENPELYGKKMRSKERKRTEKDIVDRMSKASGKLDHATIVAYESGVYNGEEEDNTAYLNNSRCSQDSGDPPPSPLFETCV